MKKKNVLKESEKMNKTKSKPTAAFNVLHPETWLASYVRKQFRKDLQQKSCIATYNKFGGFQRLPRLHLPSKYTCTGVAILTTCLPRHVLGGDRTSPHSPHPAGRAFSCAFWVTRTHNQPRMIHCVIKCLHLYHGRLAF